MAFDKNLDKQIFREVVQVEDAKLTVAIHSYNGGVSKIQISRSRKNEKSEYGWSFAKLGRITKEEMVAMLPILQQAINEM